jgi:hypothetical protein
MAISNALGRKATHYPMTPEKILGIKKDKRK